MTEPPQTSRLVRLQRTQELEVQIRWILLTFVLTVMIFAATDPFALQLGRIDPNGSAGQVTTNTPFYLKILLIFPAILYLTLGRASVPAIIAKSLVVWMFLGFNLLSSTWSDDPYLAVRASLTYISTYTLILASAAYLGPKNLARSTLYVLGISVVLSLIWALAVPKYGVHGIGDILQHQHHGKWRGIYRHKNILGQLTGLAVASCIIGWKRLIDFRICAVIVLMGLICLLKAQSASGIVVMLAGLAADYAIFRARAASRIVLLVLLALALIGYASAGEDIISSIARSVGRDATFTGRSYLWAAGETLIAQRPLLGYSISAFSSERITDVFAAASRGADLSDPHSAYLYLVITLGYVGLALFLMMIASTLIGSWRRYPNDGHDSALRLGTGLIIMWVTAALVESSPFVPGSTLDVFGTLGIFILVSLSAKFKAPAERSTTFANRRRPQPIRRRPIRPNAD